MKFDSKNFNIFFIIIAGIVTINFALIIYCIRLFQEYEITIDIIDTVFYAYKISFIPVIGFILIKFIYLKLFDTPGGISKK